MKRIRLQQVGQKHKKSFRIVVTDSRSSRNGNVIEKVGFIAGKNFKINKDLLLKHVKEGAKMTPRVFFLCYKDLKLDRSCCL